MTLAMEMKGFRVKDKQSIIRTVTITVMGNKLAEFVAVPEPKQNMSFQIRRTPLYTSEQCVIQISKNGPNAVRVWKKASIQGFL